MNDPREPDERAFAERFRRAYERTSLPGPESRARIVESARARPRPKRPGLHPENGFEPRVMTLHPFAAVAAAIALVAVGALLTHEFESRARRESTSSAAAARPPATQPVRFVFVDGSASRVALVGDFNGWDADLTPMRRDPPGGTWTVNVPLSPGWHSYAFVVNGTRWVIDPQAPLAPAEDFGTPRSVVVVGEHGA